MSSHCACHRYFPGSLYFYPNAFELAGSMPCDCTPATNFKPVSFSYVVKRLQQKKVVIIILGLRL